MSTRTGMNGRAPTVAAAVATCLAAAWASVAEAQYSRVVPGLMGPNALPAIPVEDAALPRDILAETRGALHLAGGGRDTAFTPRFQLLVPFRGIAALEVDGALFEVWRVSPATRARNGGNALSGTSAADVRFGARFALLEEKGARPAVALRLLTKSTTGKGFYDQRFTDAPAYAIETLAARTVWKRDRAAVRSVRVLLKLGLLAWTQQPGLQDDAIDYGVAADTTLRRGTELRVELRGYQGYQSHDKPMLASVRLLQPMSKRAAVTLLVNRGIRPDAPEWELGAGVRWSMRNPFG